MVSSNPSENLDNLNTKSSNYLETVDIEKLQSTHYELMTRFAFVLNYASKNDFPFKTLRLNIDSLRRNKVLTPYENNICKFIDILFIKSFFKLVYRIVYREFVRINKFSRLDIIKDLFYKIYDFCERFNMLEKFIYIFHRLGGFEKFSKYYKIINNFYKFFLKVTFILILLIGLLIFTPLFFMYSINFLQVKFIVSFMLQLHIKNVNNDLINLYSRLKTTMDSNKTHELRYRFRLTRNIDDCKNFNSTFNSLVNSKIFLSLLTFLTAFLPAILKNTFINDWLKFSLRQIPDFNVIPQQLFILLILYLPTIIILLILIQSFRAKYFILNKFNVYKLESRVYRMLGYKEADLSLENALFAQSLLQLFFAITAGIFFVPSLLDVSTNIKNFLGIILILSIVILQINKFNRTKNE